MLIVGFLHFSDPMETEEKTGSALVGKTPDTVSGLLKVFLKGLFFFLGGGGSRGDCHCVVLAETDCNRLD